MSEACYNLIKIMDEHPEECRDGNCTFNIAGQDVWIANFIFDHDTYPNKGAFNLIDKFKFRKALHRWRGWKAKQRLIALLSTSEEKDVNK